MIKELKTCKRATYHGLPCWYNPINEDIQGVNWISDKLISLLIWFDVNIAMVDEFRLLVEVDNLEKM